MMKMRWALLVGLLVIVCVSMTTAEDPKSEPEPEPGADEDSKHNAGAAGKQTKDASGKNPASVPWAFSIPAIITFVSVAKFIL